MKEKRSKIREKLSLRAVGLILAMSMVAGTLLPVGVGAEELPIDINNEEITVADVMMYEDTDMSEDEEENEAAAETEEVIDVVSEENSEEAPAETSEPEAAEPETTESEVSESEVSEPEVTEPVETEPETTEPEGTEPEVPDFEETEPDEIITEEELPADAPEEEIYFCGIEEHEHTEECRNAPEEPDGEIIVEEEIPEEEPQPEEEPGELYCGYEVHVHDDTCWNEEYLADCGMEEHEHSENCYSLAYTLMAEFAAAVELFPNEADYILLDFDEADGSELLDEEAYYRAYAAFYEENPDIWTTTDALYNEASEAFAAENPEGDLDAWMQDNGFWEAAEKFYWVVPMPEDVEAMIAQYEEAEEIELEFTAEEEAPVLYATSAVNAKEGQDVETVPNGQGIKFGLFNYDNNINNNPLSSGGYFGFRGTHLGTASTYKENASCDADGYHKNTHATVEELLVDGYPVFDPRTVIIPDGIDKSLGYLFGKSGGAGVTGYEAQNTLLQYNTQTGYYTYNSMQNACDFDTSERKFYVRKYKEQTSTTVSSYSSSLYDFLPFNSTSETAENGVYQYDSTNTADYWFGMTMEVEFSQPKDGKVNGEEMIFKFSGDDDVWVFIDDVLVLDLGGTHGTVDGTINFSTGEIKQWLSWNGGKEKKSYESADSDYKESTSLRQRFEAAGENLQGETFVNYTKHTLKFFYLERATAVANCSIEFNIPPMPDKSLRVSKDITSSSENDTTEYLKDTLEYTFRVMKADGSEVYIPEGTEFKLTNADGSETTGVVGDNGEFKLKADQSALFENVIQYAEGSGEIEYYVEEILPKDIRGQYGDVEYEVEAGTNTVIEEETGDSTDFLSFKTDIMKADDGNVVLYRNIIDTEKLSKLRITKEVSDGSTALADKEFQFKVMLGDELLPEGTEYTVDGEACTVNNTDGIITLKDGATAEIPGIISGTKYTITEVLDNLGADLAGKTLVFYDAKGYGDTTIEVNNRQTTEDTDGHGITGEFPLASTVHVTATNSTYDVKESLDLYVLKQVTGNMGDQSKAFDFTVTIEEDTGTIAEEPAMLLFSMGTAEQVGSEDIGSADGNTDVFELAHDQKYHITGIPKDYKITVTESESASGYSTVIEYYVPDVNAADGYRQVKIDVDEYGQEHDGVRTVTIPAVEIVSGGYIVFTNDKTATIDTAVHLDYLPYILILTAVIPTMTLAVSRKRRRRED